jgi:hypothetical protein
VPNIIHVNYPTFFFPSYICFNKKDAHGPYVFFAELMFNLSMSQEFILTLKYQPKLFVGAFRVKPFIGPRFWHEDFHQITHLYTCVGFVGYK